MCDSDRKYATMSFPKSHTKPLWIIIIVLFAFDLQNPSCLATFPLFRSLWYSNPIVNVTTGFISNITDESLLANLNPLKFHQYYYQYYSNQSPNLNQTITSTKNESLYRNQLDNKSSSIQNSLDEDLSKVTAANVSVYLNNDQNDDSTKEKQFEVLIKNDKTMARLKFDVSGREVVECILYDLEQDVNAVEMVPKITGLKPALDADYKTMLEAVRRCTALARRQYGLDDKPVSNVTDSNENNVLPVAGQSPFELNTLTNESIAVMFDNNTNTVDSHPNNIPTKPPLFDQTNILAFWKGIIPGTRWCGLGDMAHHYHDIGHKLDMDLCCRAHDHCPIRLKALRKGYGFFNFSFYTRSHCDCDFDFYHCLKQTSSSYAAALGNLYFNIIKVHCLKHDVKLVCANKRNKPPEKCLQHELSKEFKVKLVPFDRHF